MKHYLAIGLTVIVALAIWDLFAYDTVAKTLGKA